MLRRSFEEVLKKSEERFRRVVEAAPNAMVMINADGGIEMVNAEAEKVFGYDRSEMLGQPVELLVPDRFRHAHPGMRAAFLRNPASRPMGEGRDLFARRKDGSEFPVEIGLNPIETEEGVMMVLSAIVDISDRKQKEESIRRALREKETLLAEIHHRVKNNLQIVDSLLGLKANGIEDAAACNALFDCQNRVRAMALIHNSLYGMRDVSLVNFDVFVKQLVNNLQSTYGFSADHVSVAIAVEAVHLPIGIAVPCGLLINELISNAFKHAFPDGCGSRIAITMRHPTTDTVVVAVEDDGVGLPPDIDPENTPSIGLQLIHLLSEQLQGTLEIRRRAPTRFHLTFPLAANSGGPVP